MTRMDGRRDGSRRGFSLLEVQAAFVVLGLGVAAMVPFALAQVKLVTALERRLPPNATYVLISKDHGLVSLLAAGGGGSSSTTSAGTTTNTTDAIINPRAVAIDNVQGSGTGPMDMTATVTVKKPATDTDTGTAAGGTGGN